MAIEDDLNSVVAEVLELLNHGSEESVLDAGKGVVIKGTERDIGRNPDARLLEYEVHFAGEFTLTAE